MKLNKNLIFSVSLWKNLGYTITKSPLDICPKHRKGKIFTLKADQDISRNVLKQFHIS